MEIDRDYLRAEQYRDAGNLSRRIALHDSFSTNAYGWHRWVFDHLCLGDSAAVLEVGCGRADLWTRNRDRVPATWTTVLTDFSGGMVAAARAALGGAPWALRLGAADAVDLPFAAASFDAAVANHMLYHVSDGDRPRALAEVRRVLRPRGRLLSATNGPAHLRELRALVRCFDPEYRGSIVSAEATGFGLDNGAAQLAPHFPRLTVHRHDDGLAIDDPEALASWGLSWGPATYPPARLAALLEHLRAACRQAGVLRVSKESGLFVAEKG
ncbi:MAG: class I SAM-dependent methyltransferase [Candidatus Latescibacterota bacterium]